MMSLLYYKLFWQRSMEGSESKSTPNGKEGQNSTLKKTIDSKEPQGEKHDNASAFVDITQNQAFWDKAVPS